MPDVLVFITASRSLVMQNGSSSQTLNSSVPGRQMAFDPVRREILQYDYFCAEAAELDRKDLGCIRTLRSVTLSGQTSRAYMGPEIGYLAGNKASKILKRSRVKVK